MKEIAGKILNYIYLKKFEDNKIPSFKEILENSDLKEHQVKMALEYCKRHNYLNYTETFGGVIGIKILSDGIDIVTDEDKFQRSFGFGVNLGIASFNWGVQER